MSDPLPIVDRKDFVATLELIPEEHRKTATDAAMMLCAMLGRVSNDFKIPLSQDGSTWIYVEMRGAVDADGLRFAAQHLIAIADRYGPETTG